jgi:hypothetical protein
MRPGRLLNPSSPHPLRGIDARSGDGGAGTLLRQRSSLRLGVLRGSLHALLRALTHFCVAAGLCACTATVGGEPAFGSGSAASGDSSESGGTSGSASTGGTSASGEGTSGKAEGNSGSSGAAGGSHSGSAGTAGATAGAGTPSGSSGAATTGEDASTSGSAASGSESGSSGGYEPYDAGHRDSAVPVLTGCAADVPTAVFAASCEARSCHNSVDNIYDLDLQSPGVVSRLLNQFSLEAPAYKMIDPITPDESYILLKVKLASPPVGVQMPQMGAKLSAAETACFQQWVQTVATGPY